MEVDKFIWIFNSPSGRFPGGVFTSIELAEPWIAKNYLTGVLTQYPLDQGSFDWASKNDAVNMKPEKLEIKSKDPNFIGSFSSASFNHYHYENGFRC